MPKLPKANQARMKYKERTEPQKRAGTSPCPNCDRTFDTVTEKARHVCCPFCKTAVAHTTPCPKCGVFSCRR